MKKLLFITALLGCTLLNAQVSQDIQKNLFTHLKTNALLLTEAGLLQDASEVKAFITAFETANGQEGIYKKEFNIEVNKLLDYEIGAIQANSKSYAVMFLKTKDEKAGPKIEFLVMHEMLDSEHETSAIDSSRENWMALCNAHQAEELVKQLYQRDAYYYNRGRLLQGTKVLSSEYGYMNNPNYSLKLSPQHMVYVTADIVYEIGQCSGSYPLPYMLVWKKQDDGQWLILMDSNY